jgi:hypothetical protein
MGFPEGSHTIGQGIQIFPWSLSFLPLLSLNNQVTLKDQNEATIMIKVSPTDFQLGRTK